MGADLQLLDRPEPRRFQLFRRRDVHGMSGTGIVAEGIQFRDLSVAYRWITAPATTQFANSISDVKHIHGHSGRTTVRWLDDAEPPGEEKTITEVYDDRNLLALAFARLAADHPSDEWDGGWHPEDADDADAGEWAICWATTPTGQVSWHVPMELAENVAGDQQRVEWDGHNRKEKNNRLYRLVTEA